MPFQTIPADRAIIDSVKLIMLGDQPIGGWPDGVEKSGGGVVIPLQFPPRVKSTSKSGVFIEQEAGAYEPQATWKGSSGTSLSIELDYIITGVKYGNITWDAAGVATAVHTVMAYFYRDIVAGDSGGQSAGGGAGVPILQVRLYQVAPAAGQISTWRILDANVSYSEELILTNGKVYPQKATVTLNLMMYTKIFDRDSKEKQQIKAADKPLKEWY